MNTMIVRQWELVLALVVCGGCVTEAVDTIPPLSIGEFRGGVGMEKPTTINALRAVELAWLGPEGEEVESTCVGTPKSAVCVRPDGDNLALQCDSLNRCDLVLNDDVVGRLALRVDESTWILEGDVGALHVTSMRDGEGAFTSVRWLAPIAHAKAAYAGPVSERCTSELNAISVWYLPQQGLQDACGMPGVALEGCSYKGGSVFIERGREGDESLHAHEYLHVLLACETGKGDAYHQGKAWGRL